MYYVYILYSESFDTFYKGQTRDFLGRLKRHNQRKELSTAPYAPWKPLWVTKKTSRSEAMELERKLKNLSKSNTFRFIEKYSQDNWKP